MLDFGFDHVDSADWGCTLGGRGGEFIYPGFRILRHEHQPRYFQNLKGALGDKSALLPVKKWFEIKENRIQDAIHSGVTYSTYLASW